MKKKILISSLIMIALNWSSNGLSQVVMEPSKVVRTIHSGELIRDEITLHNVSDSVVDLKVYWEDFLYVDPYKGAKKFLPRGTTEYSFSDWISFFPKTVSIAAKSQIDIRYTIKVPASIRGGYYGVMFFEQGQPFSAEKTGVKVITRLGSLFILEDVDSSKKAEIKDVKILDGKINGLITNLGNLILRTNGVLYVLDGEGVVVHRGEFEKIYLPPDKFARFDLNVPKELKTGEYTIVATFDLGGGDSVVKEIDFLKDQTSLLHITATRN